jgi:alkanesulfonate monooxygenase SsuD/methylene tetrahydromethanopterin reductase-like flavin-dependent oxidoreductase (luciferase family)
MRFGVVLPIQDVQEPFDVTGRHGRWRGHVTPAPFGNIRPEVVMGAHGPRGLELAAQRADLWLSDPQRHVEATLTALARFGEEVIGPMGGTQ